MNGFDLIRFDLVTFDYKNKWFLFDIEVIQRYSNIYTNLFYLSVRNKSQTYPSISQSNNHNILPTTKEHIHI